MSSDNSINVTDDVSSPRKLLPSILSFNGLVTGIHLFFIDFLAAPVTEASHSALDLSHHLSTPVHSSPRVYSELHTVPPLQGNPNAPGFYPPLFPQYSSC